MVPFARLSMEERAVRMLENPLLGRCATVLIYFSCKGKFVKPRCLALNFHNEHLLPNDLL